MLASPSKVITVHPDRPDGTNDRFGFIACGIGCGVSDVINTWCVGIDCTIGIGGTVAIHNIVPLRSLIHVSGGCEMGHSHPQSVHTGGVYRHIGT